MFFKKIVFFLIILLAPFPAISDFEECDSDFLDQNIGLPNGEVKRGKYICLDAYMGILESQLNLGNLYRQNKDYEKAFSWFMEAAKKGHQGSQFYVAVAYSKGDGVKKNTTEAFKWLHKVANSEHREAQFLLGTMYYEGQAINQNFREAAKWFRKSANQNWPNSQYNLALLYMVGRGIEQSDIKAYMWLSLPTTLEMETTEKARKILSDRMSLNDIAIAEEMAHEWLIRNGLRF